MRLISRMKVTAALLSPVLLWPTLLIDSPIRAESIELKLRNGDTVRGELIKEESGAGLTVIEHPQLGRLSVRDTDRMPEQKPRWTSSIAAGMIGNNKDGDGSLSVNVSADTLYKDETQKLALRGSFNNLRSKDAGESEKMDTNKGSAGIRYDRSVTSAIDVFALSNIQYDGLNDAGVNTVLGNIGVAFPLIRNDQTGLTLSFGPSVQWTGGGVDCSTDKYCGRTYAASTVTADLFWSPVKAFRFSLQNQFSAAYDQPILPSNTFTAEIRFYPTSQSKLFTSLQYQSIYQSMTTPEINNTVTAQVGADF